MHLNKVFININRFNSTGIANGGVIPSTSNVVFVDLKHKYNCMNGSLYIENVQCNSFKFRKKLHNIPTIFNVFLLKQTTHAIYNFMDTI